MVVAYDFKKIEKFEDIKAWKEARELVRIVYNAIENNKRFEKDFRKGVRKKNYEGVF